MPRFFSSARLPERVAQRGRSSRARLAAFVAGLAIIAAFPAQVSASHLDPGMSISIGSQIKLVSGVYLAVPVQVTCPVLTAPLTEIFSDGIDVNITQKTGRTFAVGGGSLGYQSPAYNGVTFGSPVVCDGSRTHTRLMSSRISRPRARSMADKPWSAATSTSACTTVFVHLLHARRQLRRFGPQSISIH